MGTIKGLKNINAYNEEREAAREAASRPQTTWFKINANQTVKVAFLQELDPDSKNYSEKNDLALLAVEHTSPHDFRKRALDTMEDEGRDWAQEQHVKDRKAGWGARTRLYANVLVDDGKQEPYVALMSQSMSGQAITPVLIEEAGDDGTITENWYAVKKTGEGTATSYSLRKKEPHGLNVEDYELFEIEKVLRKIPYDEQEAFYMSGVQNAPAEKKPETPSVGSTGDSESW